MAELGAAMFANTNLINFTAVSQRITVFNSSHTDTHGCPGICLLCNAVLVLGLIHLPFLSLIWFLSVLFSLLSNFRLSNCHSDHSSHLLLSPDACSVRTLFSNTPFFFLVLGDFPLVPENRGVC